MTRSITLLLLAALLVAESSVTSFVIPQKAAAVRSSFVVTLDAKKKKGGGQGFGKAVEEAAAAPAPAAAPVVAPVVADNNNASILRSVEGGSNAIPQIDTSMPVEERTKAILRDSYGLRTREEQDREAKKAQAEADQRKKLEDWKNKAEKGEDFDIMKVLPGPVLMGIDRFLKAGTVVCTLLFVAAGVLITVEAWSKASDSPLPQDLDQFIVNLIEPNFTPGLLVLLGFSVSLGIFASLQLSSSSSTYREDR